MIKNKSFILLVLTRLSINIADSLFYIITLWYISSQSPILTGVAVMCFTFPENLLVFVGPFVDRFNPKKILQISTLLQVSTIILLIVMLENGYESPILMMILIIISTFLSAVTYPVEETMVPQIVRKNQLLKANSIIEVTYKIANFLFNGLSGLLVCTFSIFFLYKLDLILFSIPLILLKMIDFEVEDISEEKFDFTQYKIDLIDGIKFLSQKKFRDIIIPIIIINFFFTMTTVGMPFFARSFENPEIMFGLIMSISAIGGFCGIFVSNYLNSKLGAGKVITIGLILQGSFWIAMLLFSGNLISLPFLFISYVFFGSTNIMFGSLFQSMIPVKFLGRANAAIDTAITLAMPLGSLIAGYMIGVINLNYILIFYGLSSIISGVYYYNTKDIYEYIIDEDDDEDSNDALIEDAL